MVVTFASELLSSDAVVRIRRTMNVNTFLRVDVADAEVVGSHMVVVHVHAPNLIRIRDVIITSQRLYIVAVCGSRIAVDIQTLLSELIPKEEEL